MLENEVDISLQEGCENAMHVLLKFLAHVLRLHLHTLTLSTKTNVWNMGKVFRGNDAPIMEIFQGYECE